MEKSRQRKKEKTASTNKSRAQSAFIRRETIQNQEKPFQTKGFYGNLKNEIREKKVAIVKCVKGVQNID